MVDTTRSKSTLNNLESTSPTTNNVGLGDPHILVDHLVVSLGSIVEAKLVPHRISEGRGEGGTYDSERSDESHAGVVGGDDNNGLLVVLGGRGVPVSLVSPPLAKDRAEKATYDFPMTR